MGEIDILFELGALLPSIGLGLLFWFILRSILRADRLQREAEREAEREYLEKRGPSKIEETKNRETS